MSTSSESAPTQDQLYRLRNTVLGYEAEPYDLLGRDEQLKNTDLTNFVDLTAPVLWDEKLGPATILKAPDDRAIWITVFRHPDKGDIVRTSILILDPPARQRKTGEVNDDEDYSLTENALGQLAIERANTLMVSATEVDALQELINSSKEVSLLQGLE